MRVILREQADYNYSTAQMQRRTCSRESIASDRKFAN